MDKCKNQNSDANKYTKLIHTRKGTVQRYSAILCFNLVLQYRGKNVQRTWNFKIEASEDQLTMFGTTWQNCRQYCLLRVINIHLVTKKRKKKTNNFEIRKKSRYYFVSVCNNPATTAAWNRMNLSWNRPELAESNNLLASFCTEYW